MTRPKVDKKINAKDASYVGITEFIKDFSAETDRAAVILGAARLDLALYNILEAALLPNTGSKDELLDGDSPLATFSARINVCYRLGLIDSEMTRGLHLIRKIRNIFAHETASASLNSGSHRDRVRELARPFVKFSGYDEFKTRFFKTFEDAALEFRAVLALLAIRLDCVDHEVERLKPSACITPFPPLWLESAVQESAPSASKENQ